MTELCADEEINAILDEFKKEYKSYNLKMLMADRNAISIFLCIYSLL
ncbi:MAG: hypothetical protein IJA34_13685 [Lachnospiraceae bacterium]|nr:hypothetical protein [Lachnospiraceae bacterium]